MNTAGPLSQIDKWGENVGKAWVEPFAAKVAEGIGQELARLNEATTGDQFSVHMDAEVEVRDAAKREIDVRLVPWDMPIDTLQGREQFVRGAFDDVDPKGVLLMGLEHEAHIGVGQDGQPRMVRRPVGRSTALHSRDDGQHATFRVAKTSAGDELLELAAEGIVRGVSVEFTETPGGTTVEKIGNRRTLFRRKVGLPGVSLTYRPAYGEQAAVLAVRSQPQKENPPVTDQVQPAEPIAPVVNVTIGAEAFAPLTETLTRTQAELAEKFGGEIAELKEQMRSQISIPASEPAAPVAPHIWLQRAVFERTRDKVPADLAVLTRALDDTVVAENPGLFTTFQSDEVITNINSRRPFLTSTRQVDAPPPNTMSIQLPKVTQHVQFGVQATEKTAIASRSLQTTPVTYDMVSIFGGTDVSIQFIKRGTPTAMRVLLDDMEAGYAQFAESEALDALFDEGDVVEGGAIDPNDLSLGAAFTNSYNALGEGPDTIWLGTGALAQFIDAKSSTSNQPLYGSITADINAAGGISGTLSGLRVVHVPQLTAASALVGPSRGFSWAEQYPIRLEVDNPELAGRDIALGGFMWFMPRYPGAFTSYGIGS